jgi:cytidine deaminase
VIHQADQVLNNIIDLLVEAAWEARDKAHAPYSRFPVGAALLGKSGQVYSGCNVENCSYGLTICAERVALFNAVAAGEREFVAVAIVADTPEVVSPCGACRQTLAEFGLDTLVVSENKSGKRTRYTVGELLPHPFVPADITKKDS